MKHRTHEEFINLMMQKYGDTIDLSNVKYKNDKTKVLLKCNKCGNVYMNKPHNLLNGFCGCEFCNIQNQKERIRRVFNERAKLRHPEYEFDINTYIDEYNEMTFLCKKHGYFTCLPKAFLKNETPCKECRKEKRVETARKIIVEKIERAKVIHNNKYTYEIPNELKTTKTKILITCPIHGVFKQSVEKHVERMHGCPLCGKTNQEKEKFLYFFLKKHFKDIEIVYSYRNKELLGKQEYDIYFPKFRIAIEYQGIQHFEPVDFFGGDVGFIKTKERDIKKLETSQKNGIKLLYFSYETKYDKFLENKIYHTNEDIVKKINEIINEQNGTINFY